MNMITLAGRSLASMALLLSLATHAQFIPRYAAGINLGSFIYSGDLSPWQTGSWKTPAFVLGLTGHRVFTPTLAGRLELNFGRLKGDEAKYAQPEYRQQRAFAFNTRVTEVIAAAEWNPLGRERKLSPYLFGGVGYAGLRVSRDYSRFNAEYFSNEPTLFTDLEADIAQTPPRGTLILPVGAGLQYGLSQRFTLNAEASQRITTTDYIDGFSQSGNPDKKDSYTKYSLGLRMWFGGKDRYGCPPVNW